VPGAAGDWVSLRIVAPPALADAVANFLFEEGASGVVTEDGNDAAELDASVPAAAAPRVCDALRRWLESLAALDPDARLVRIESRSVPDVDWDAVYRLHHRPVAVGRRLLVAPPWARAEPGGRELLLIEPGMAFGTGQHATTRTCLEAIEAAVEGGGIAAALDVGTGSGILALALARLGVPRVVALDHDAAVLPIARANLARNGAGGVLLVGGPIAAVRARFDLVVANLLADAIVAAAPALGDVVAPRGVLVVSGLLVSQVASVEAAYPAWRVVARRGDATWSTLTLARKG
jgi:ribosomal protein L11 methyltransferase